MSRDCPNGGEEKGFGGNGGGFGGGGGRGGRGCFKVGNVHSHLEVQYRNLSFNIHCSFTTDTLLV